MDDKVIVLNKKTAELDSLSTFYKKLTDNLTNELIDSLNNDYIKPEPYYVKYNKRRKK